MFYCTISKSRRCDILFMVRLQRRLVKSRAVRWRRVLTPTPCGYGPAARTDLTLHSAPAKSYRHPLVSILSPLQASCLYHDLLSSSILSLTTMSGVL